MCDSLYLNSIQVSNSSPSESVIINIQSTKNVTFEDIKLENLPLTLATFKDSTIESITNVNISQLSQAFYFERSEVKNISDSVFLRNTVDKSGGAIGMLNSQLNVMNTTFDQNSAEQGGAIFFECTSMLSCQLEISNCSFTNNTARVQGGAIYYNYNYPRITDSEFSLNSAVYGNDFASYPARIGLTNSSYEDYIKIDEIGPGVTISQDLNLALLDLDDQVMTLDDTSQIIIVPSDPATAAVSGANVITVNQGVSTFSSLSVEVQRGLKYSNFSISSKSIDTRKVREVKGSNFTQKALEVNFRDCQPGERILGNQCQVCAAGTYSIAYNSTECTD